MQDWWLTSRFEKNMSQKLRIIIVAGDKPQTDNLHFVLEQADFSIVAQTTASDNLLASVDKDIADVILYDLYSLAELDFDAIDSLIDGCSLPVLFNDVKVDADADFVEKFKKRMGTVISDFAISRSDLSKTDVGTVLSSPHTIDSILDKRQSSLELKTDRLQSQLGELLVQAGKLDSNDLVEALVTQNATGKPIGVGLVDMDLVSELDVAIALSQQLILPLIRSFDYPASVVLADRISERFINKYQVMPLRETNHEVFVAMLNPEHDYVIKALKVACRKEVTPCIAVKQEFLEAMQRLYSADNNLMSQIAEEMESTNEDTDQDNIEQLKDQASEAPIIRLVSLIIHNAIKASASDIHIEPFEKLLKVRYRIDGILQDVEAPPTNAQAAIISRIKIMAKLDIAERRLPQDGRVKLRIEGKNVDLRVSTVPTLHGERVVIRLLLKENVVHDFADLGFAGKPLDDFLKCLQQPSGILLVTGPTGSGKTTTLYTALQKINTPGRNIITVEDPVEYQLDGINQIQVKAAIGLNFAAALRSIVRQDPDIIMIGEIRDLETAKIAIQSSLTGHMVLSTLHTNDAPSSITRLMEMGIEDYLLTSAISGILAQRLVRKLCTHCREHYVPDAGLLQELALDHVEHAESILYRSVGCAKCHTTGFNGRVSIVQMMPMSESIRQLITAHAPVDEIAKKALSLGVSTMFRDGIDKALTGVTTLEEVLRVTHDLQ